MTEERSYASQTIAEGKTEASGSGSSVGFFSAAGLSGHLSSQWSLWQLLERAASHNVEILDLGMTSYPGDHPAAQTPVQGRMIAELAVEITDIVRRLESTRPGLRQWRESSSITFHTTGDHSTSAKTAKLQFTNSVPALQGLKRVGIATDGIVDLLGPEVDQKFFSPGN
jgi:hypothetical protein